MQDLSYALRKLLKYPGFTAAAVITLGLAIGANSAIFSAVHAVLLRPLPYEAPQQLTAVWESFTHLDNALNPVAPANFAAWRDGNSSFQGMAHYSSNSVSLTGTQRPEKVNALYSADSLLHLLGVKPLLGRAFAPGEAAQQGEWTAAVISYRLWQRSFGAQEGVIGRQIRIDGHPVAVAGVMPASFQFPDSSIDLWMATDLEPRQAGEPQAHYLRVVGRLKPGAPLQQAQAELEAVAAHLAEQYPDTNRYIGVRVIPLHEQMTGDIRLSLLVLLAAAGFVLLIACANVSNLMLARAESRRKEIALRLALGAGRGRIVRQLLTESALLSVFGGAAGLLLALWGMPALVALAPEGVAQVKSASVDVNVLTFTLAVSLSAAALFGLAPALQSSRLNPNQDLKEDARGTTGAGRGRTRKVLVSAEIALALMLLTGGGLLMRSFLELNSVDPGFRSDRLLVAEVFPPYSKYSDTQSRAAFYDQVLQRAEALPGVAQAAFVTQVPARGDFGHMTFITEQPGGRKVVSAAPRAGSPGYFRCLGIPLAAGRAFDGRDRAEAPKAVVINRAMARTSWPGQDPIGKRMKMGLETEPWLTVAGMVEDVRFRLGSSPVPQVYLPYAQSPAFGPRDLVLRTESDPAALAAALRRQVWAVDPDQPVGAIATMEQLLADSIQGPRFNTLLVTLFSLIALALAAVGIYGVMSYAVSQSRREIGIRMALGARPGDVARLVVGQGAALTLTGVLAGLMGAWALTRWMSSLLFSVSADDPATFILTAAFLTALALSACGLPARRASRLDVIQALK